MNLSRLISLATSLAAVVVLLCGGTLASIGPLSTLTTTCTADNHQNTAGPESGCVPEVLQRWNSDQVGHAATIITVGVDLGVPVYGQVIAVATAMQESSLRNLPHLGPGNDHDSIGLFQQRPSQGWGTPEQLRDPTYAATAFYQALMRVDRWQQMTLAEAAQAVQRSAHPDAYTRWAGDAAALVGMLAAGDGWVRPLAGVVVSGYGPRDGRLHAGVDIAAPRGTIIAAAAAGTVTRVACQAWHVDGSWWGCDRDGHPDLVRGCGHYLDIEHAGQVVTRYCHLDTQPWVATGQQVTAGQPLGPVGTTGRSSGPHLHFEVLLPDASGVPVAVDPQPWLGERGVHLGHHQP